MFESNPKIETVIIVSTVLILIFAIVVILAIVKYRGKQLQFKEREKDIKNEIIKASLEAKEETFKDLANRIHGDIQQTLSLAKLNLNKVLMKPKQIDISRIQQSKELIANTISEVKALSKELDPKYIFGYTLEENIIRQLNRVEERSGIKTTFKTNELEISISNEVQILMYRIFQEAINNILSHSAATSIKVSLINNRNHILMIIKDNGKGFNTQEIMNKKNNSKQGIGLMSMRNRIQLLNGDFNIESELNNGTNIFLKIPKHA